MAEGITDLDMNSFDETIGSSDTPVLVDFWAETVKAVRDLNPKTTIETLIPDFKGETENIDRIIEVAPEVVSHNLETVRRLTREGKSF